MPAHYDWLRLGVLNTHSTSSLNKPTACRKALNLNRRSTHLVRLRDSLEPIDPRNPVGSSEDRGESWEPIAIRMPAIAVSAMVVAPT